MQATAQLEPASEEVGRVDGSRFASRISVYHIYTDYAVPCVGKVRPGRRSWDLHFKPHLDPATR